MKIKQILLVTNSPAKSEYAEQAAIELAITQHADILLMDTISTRFRSKQPIDASRTVDMVLDAKYSYLKEMQLKIGDLVNTDAIVKTGSSTSQEIINAVRENDIDIVVRYSKGSQSHSSRKYGETATELIKHCPVPVLFVDHPCDLKQITAFVNLHHTHATNAAILDAAYSLVVGDSKISAIAFWDFVKLQSSTDDDLSRKLLEIYYLSKFNQLADQHQDARTHFELVEGTPVDKIVALSAKNHFGVAVIGCGCSAPSKIHGENLLGQVFEELDCSVLAVKPEYLQNSEESKEVKSSNSISG